MATQICPKCSADSFTWSFDTQQSKLTRWGCYSCNYTAYEDEALERICSNCGRKTECRLEDESEKYWWCSNCNRMTMFTD